MPKLNVTIPEELHERLGLVRDNFIISRICQEALDREIRIQELLLNSKNEEDIIQRFRLEKEKLTGTSRQLGMEAGIEHAKVMSYIQIRNIYDAKKTFMDKKGDNINKDWANDDVYGLIDSLLPENERKIKMLKKEGEGYFEDFSEYFSKVSEYYENQGVDCRQFILGFIKGVISFYNSIKEKVGDEDIQFEIEGEDNEDEE